MSEYIVKCKEHVGISGETIQFPEYIDMNQEVVRCRDCKYSDAIKTRYQQETVYACMNFDSVAIEPDGFCSWGERREP